MDFSVKVAPGPLAYKPLLLSPSSAFLCLPLQLPLADSLKTIRGA